MSGGAAEAERLARVVLSRIGEPGDPRLTDLVHELGGRTGAGGLREQAAAGELGADLRRAARLGPTRAGARAGRRGSASGSSYPVTRSGPPAVDDLAHAPHLHERGGVPARPLVPWPAAARRGRRAGGGGRGLALGDHLRRARWPAEIAAVLAREGWTVVSGAAFGIDQAAHRGALAERGPTVAVLACGADRAYPTAHRPMIDYIADVGPGRLRGAAGLRADPDPVPGPQPADRRPGPRDGRGRRRRCAAARSTPRRWAGGLGRTVMGVPGPVTSAPSAGVHQLIRARDALLVTSGEEVLEAVGPSGAFALADPREPERARDLLPARERQVLDAVPLVRGRRLPLDRPHGRHRPRPHPRGPARPAPRRAGRAQPRPVAGPATAPRSRRDGLRRAAVAPAGEAAPRVRSLTRWRTCPRRSRPRSAALRAPPRRRARPGRAHRARLPRRRPGLLEHAAALGHTDVRTLDLRTLRSWLAKQQTLGKARIHDGAAGDRRAGVHRLGPAHRSRRRRPRRRARLAQGAQAAAGRR